MSAPTNTPDRVHEVVVATRLVSVIRAATPEAALGAARAVIRGGVKLIEVTYSWPGVAFRLQEAISQRDYPVVQGIVVVVAALVVGVSVLVDLLVALLDPRIKF